jgi:hypothetical protein
MKERIKKMFIILLVMIGVLTSLALIYVYLPSWVYYSLSGLFFVWILYDGSKPEKKKTHYWIFTYIDGLNGNITIGYGTQHTKEDEFDFCLFFSRCPKGYIINIEKTSKTQYEKLNEELEKRNKA